MNAETTQEQAIPTAVALTVHALNLLIELDGARINKTPWIYNKRWHGKLLTSLRRRKLIDLRPAKHGFEYRITDDGTNAILVNGVSVSSCPTVPSNPDEQCPMCRRKRPDAEWWAMWRNVWCQTCTPWWFAA